MTPLELTIATPVSSHDVSIPSTVKGFCCVESDVNLGLGEAAGMGLYMLGDLPRSTAKAWPTNDRLGVRGGQEVDDDLNAKWKG